MNTKMVDLDAIVDKSSGWPCFTPGMHWALSDKIFDIASLTNIDINNDCVEYEIDVLDLPSGEEALHHFNALHNIVVRLSDWPKVLARKAVSASLCIGIKALEQVPFGPDGKAIFTMFSDQTILPLFILGDDKLTVRIHFKNLTNDETCMAPQNTVDATGLLVKYKSKNTAFFVAACSTAVLTYDGQQWHVIQQASGDEILDKTPMRRSKQLFVPHNDDIKSELFPPYVCAMNDDRDRHNFERHSNVLDFANKDDTDFVGMWNTLNGINTVDCDISDVSK